MDTIRFIFSLPCVIAITIISLIVLFATSGEANPNDLIARGLHDYVVALNHAIIPNLIIYWIMTFIFKKLTSIE